MCDLHETPSELAGDERRRTYEREKSRHRRAAMTPEQAEKRRSDDREYARRRRAAMTEDERSQYERDEYQRRSAARTEKDRAEQAAYQRDYRRRRLEANPEGEQRRRRNAYLQRTYGIGIEDQDRMFADQDGCCAACLDACDMAQMHVDHSHETGRVRALLCQSCNQAEGLLRSDAQRARRLAQYIEDQAVVDRSAA